MKKIALVLIAMALGSFSSSAQIEKVDQEVFGMDCAPCAYGLERGLKKMDGVKNVQVSLNEGKAHLELSENNHLSLDQIQDEVRKNGFSAKKAEVLLKGRLEKVNDGWKVILNNEEFLVSNVTSSSVLSRMQPRAVSFHGTVEDKEDDQLNGRWEIVVTEILD
ncbi:heavy-metal-associated domain-containing protein [Zunongwangia sp. H14]|uniref:heavy-metal-associated domain-containing protein n=1 Tax=Zunongwangia sp. H14 TaxID=3240792 RepID=UPI00356AC82B